MEETYNGYRIEYDDFQEKFVAHIGDSQYRNISLSKVKKYIVDLEKKDFKRIDVIIYHGGYQTDFRKAAITSISEDQASRYPECWISYKEKTRGYGGSRQKIHINKCILDTETNRKLIDSIKEKEKIITGIKTEISEINEQLIRYQLPGE